jgi:hypothetical protein
MAKPQQVDANDLSRFAESQARYWASSTWHLATERWAAASGKK